MTTDVLRRARLVNREVFDPTNPEHIASFKTFLATNTWGDVQFYPEAPYTEAPATVMAKYARHSLAVELETDEVREARMAARNVLPFPKPDTTAQTIAAREERLATANALMSALLQRA
jgi:hypothetical protein